MTRYELLNDNEPDVVFDGAKFAEVSSQKHDGPGSQRWTELSLYTTARGKLIAHEVGRTIWEGEHDRFAVHICEGEADLIEALGYGWLAKALYDEAGITHQVTID